MYFTGNIELRKSKYYLFLLHVRSIHACPSIVRPFYVANHHPLYIASTSLANNSVSTRCCTHVRNQKGCDSEREGVREREREHHGRKLEQENEGGTNREEIDAESEANNGWLCIMRRAMNLECVYEKNECVRVDSVR